MQDVVGVILVAALLFFVPLGIGIKTRRVRIAALLGVLLSGGALISFGALVWISTAEDEVLDAVVSVDGRELVVAYFGGDCEDQRSVSVNEDQRAVRISVTSRSFASSCNDMAVLHKVAITLDEPLNAREIVNEGCTPDRAGCKRVLAPPT